MPEQTLTQQTSRAQARPEGGAIPRVVHQIWYQGEAQMPEKYRRFRDTWRRNHPGWEFVFWDEARMRDFVRRDYSWFAETFDGYPSDIQRIDSVRYLILNTFGGFYIDMDVESLKPIDDLLGGCDLILSKTVGYNNAIIGSAPGHPLWQAVFDNLCVSQERPPARFFEFHKRSPAYQESMTTGPIFFSNTVKEGGFDRRPGTRVCPGSFFEPDFPREVDGEIVRKADYGEAYARHYGDLNWLPSFYRLLSLASSGLFKIYWFFRGRAKS